MEEKDLDFFDLREIPYNWREAIKSVYRSYPKKCMPMGLCDMAYIANTIARVLGLGDGKGKFEKFVVVKD